MEVPFHYLFVIPTQVTITFKLPSLSGYNIVSSYNTRVGKTKLTKTVSGYNIVSGYLKDRNTKRPPATVGINNKPT